MPFTLTMPKLSPTMETGTIVKWHKKEGDEVCEGDVLFEVATDKATVEYNAIDGGFLRQILKGENAEAHVNEAVAVFTTSLDESMDGYTPEGTATEAPAPESHDTEAQSEPVKAAAAPVTGGLQEPAFTPAAALDDYVFEWPTRGHARIFASPLAKKLAEERGIDLQSVKGTGPGGRILSRDLDLSHPKNVVSFSRAKVPTEKPGTFVEEDMTPMRATIGKRLQASKTFIPHFYVQQDICAKKLFTLRNELKDFNLKLTFNDFVMRASALALKQHPVINSGYDSVNKKVIRFKTIDICVAVSIDGGLLTPIVRHADFKNLGELSQEVKMLVMEAKNGTLKPEDYTGGSFTISNLGMYGITDFQAVINPPQASILAVGGIIDKPVVEKGEVVPGKVMTLSLSSDHRVVDGADAALFLNTIKKYLENPSALLV